MIGLEEAREHCPPTCAALAALASPFLSSLFWGRVVLARWLGICPKGTP